MNLNIITHESSKNKDDTNDDESLNGSESICLWNLVGDTIEDVDKTEEDSDKDGHPSRNTLWRNKKADPRNYHKHS